MALEDPEIEGLVFIQTEADPFVFVDGYDVRYPATGDVHPAFTALLDHFGSVEAGMTADTDALQAVDGVGEVTATQVREVVGEPYDPS